MPSKANLAVFDSRNGPLENDSRRDFTPLDRYRAQRYDDAQTGPRRLGFKCLMNKYLPRCQGGWLQSRGRPRQGVRPPLGLPETATGDFGEGRAENF